MKKIVLCLFGIIFTASSAFALVDHYKSIAAGQYLCPEAERQTCIINKYKTGEVHFGRECLEGKKSKVSKYAPMIKRGECRVAPDPGKYFICEYADSKCFIIKYAAQDKVSCTSKKKQEMTKEQRKAMVSKIRQDIAAGNCRPMYPDKNTPEK